MEIKNGKNHNFPDRSVCSGGWTSDSNRRIYPMQYTRAGCGKQGVNYMSGSTGSAHCCEYIDEDPNGKTVPGKGGTYTPSIGAAAAVQDYASAGAKKRGISSGGRVNASWYGWSWETTRGRRMGRVTKGQGDCDQDADCAPGLKCGFGKTNLPGLNNNGVMIYGRDFCYDPNG